MIRSKGISAAMSKLIAVLILLWPLACFAEDPNPSPIEQTDYYSPDNVLKFADCLFYSKDYLRAAAEYQRYLFLNRESGDTEFIYYLIIKSVFRGGDYQRCWKLLNEFALRYPASPRLNEVPLYKAIVLNRQRNFNGSLELAQAIDSKNPELRAGLMALDYLQLGDYDRARQLACGFAAEGRSIAGPSSMDKYNIELPALCNYISSADTLRFKSRFLAGLYSAIIPGAGKAYSGRFTDGIYSLLVIGLTGWQAYNGFHDDGRRSTKGWIFGILSGGFYLGNIYGSVIAADLHNHQVHEKFVQGLQFEITLP